jgi:hypothetical protein
MGASFGLLCLLAYPGSDYIPAIAPLHSRAHNSFPGYLSAFATFSMICAELVRPPYTAAVFRDLAVRFGLPVAG